MLNQLVDFELKIRGVEIKDKFMINNVIILICKNEIILKFEDNYSPVELFGIFNFFLKKKLNIRQVFNVYIGFDFKLERKAIKKKTIEEFSPENFFKIMEGLDDSVLYSYKFSTSKLIALEIRYEEEIWNFIKKEEEIFKILGEVGDVKKKYNFIEKR